MPAEPKNRVLEVADVKQQVQKIAGTVYAVAIQPGASVFQPLAKAFLRTPVESDNNLLHVTALNRILVEIGGVKPNANRPQPDYGPGKITLSSRLGKDSLEQ